MKENIKSAFRLVKQLNYVLTTKQKIKSIWVFFAMIVSSCLDLLSVSAIIPFITLLTDYESLRSKWYISWIYDVYPDVKRGTIIMLVCLILIAVYVLKNVIVMYSSYVQVEYAASFNRDNAIKMLDSYLKRPYEYFTNTNSSIMIRGINTDVAGVYSILIDIFNIISELLTITMIGCYLLLTDWFIALSTVSVAAVCMLVVVAIFKNKMKKAGQENQVASMRRGEASYQAINGIKEITVLDRRQYFVDMFDKATKLERKSAITKNFIGSCPDRIIEGICIGAFVMAIGIRIMTIESTANVVLTLGVFAMGAFRILPSFSKISSKINDIVFFIPCLQNCCDNFIEAHKYDLMEKENNKIDKEVIGESEKLVESKENSNIVFKDSLKIDHISWQYSSAKKKVLDNISFEIKKGESVAFIGSSGAGKSTMADIIMGLYKPQKGDVTMDGYSIYDIPHSWAKVIGYVPQTVYLIDDNIRKNVAFGIPEDEIDEDKIWKALEQAQLKEYVEKLPDKLDSHVGERGVKFSGGQRQRIAIARALYENPEIIVFDEATSALDNETEKAVMEAVDALSGYKTLIIIAHRLSTIKNCNTIYEFGDGKITKRDSKEIV